MQNTFSTERLPLAVVVDGEIFSCEVGHQAPARAGHGGVDRDGPVGGAELRRLRLRRGYQHGAGCESYERDDTTDAAIHEGSPLRTLASQW